MKHQEELANLGVKVPSSLKQRMLRLADGRPATYIIIRALSEFLDREEGREA